MSCLIFYFSVRNCLFFCKQLFPYIILVNKNFFWNFISQPLYTEITWCSGLAVTLPSIQKVEKNVKVNCDKCCGNMQGPLTVFSTADHKQTLYPSYVGVVHALCKSKSDAILFHDKFELGRRLRHRYLDFSLSLLFILLQKSSDHLHIFFATKFITCLFCHRSVLQIFCVFALLSHSSSVHLPILLAQHYHSHLSHYFVTAALSL